MKINVILKTKMNSSIYSSPDSSEKKMCNICNTHLVSKTNITLRCGHTFHEECMTKWQVECNEKNVVVCCLECNILNNTQSVIISSDGDFVLKSIRQYDYIQRDMARRIHQKSEKHRNVNIIPQPTPFIPVEEYHNDDIFVTPTLKRKFSTLSSGIDITSLEPVELTAASYITPTKTIQRDNSLPSPPMKSYKTKYFREPSIKNLSFVE